MTLLAWELHQQVSERWNVFYCCHRVLFSGAREREVLHTEDGSGSVEIPDKINESCVITGIYANGLEDCSSIVSVKLPESINEIQSGAFSGCEKLASINVPQQVTVIPDSCFYRNTDLKAIDIKGITEIGEQAFYQTGLESIVVPCGITSIPSKCFSVSEDSRASRVHHQHQ